jgi:hypothetical protein
MRPQIPGILRLNHRPLPQTIMTRIKRAKLFVASIALTAMSYLITPSGERCCQDNNLRFSPFVLNSVEFRPIYHQSGRFSDGR